MQPPARRAAEVIALFADAKLRALLQPAERARSGGLLTQRERDVLQWSAAGKTSWEIGTMMGLSERGINKIVARAMIRLNSVTRTQAVAQALHRGEIELS